MQARREKVLTTTCAPRQLLDEGNNKRGTASLDKYLLLYSADALAGTLTVS